MPREPFTQSQIETVCRAMSEKQHELPRLKQKWSESLVQWETRLKRHISDIANLEMLLSHMMHGDRP